MCYVDRPTDRVLSLLLDLSSGSDTVDHNVLLDRLETCVGLSGTARRWFKSYLNDRDCFVSIGNYTSEQMKSQAESHRAPFWSLYCPTFTGLLWLRWWNTTMCYHSPADDTHFITHHQQTIITYKHWADVLVKSVTGCVRVFISKTKSRLK